MTRTSISLLAGGAVLLTALTASAQEPRPERPYRGMFGGGTDQSTQVLSVSGAAGSGYDTSATNAASEAGFGGVVSPSVPGQGQGSLYNQFSGGLFYKAQLEKFAAGASWSSSARQYPQLDISTTTSHSVSSGVSLGLGKNTKLSGGAAAAYQSRRAFTPFAELGDPVLGEVTTPSQDFGTLPVKYYTYGVNAGLTQQLSRKSSLAVGYDKQVSQRSNGIEDLSRETGEFRFTRSLTRYMGVRLGYGYTEARYPTTARRYQNHNFDTGIDYSRDLSLTRRTKLSFSSGGTALRQGDVNRYDVIGSARLSREIARTWNADVTYQRNTGFLDSVREPIFYDAVNTGIGGLITRRVSFRSGAGYTRGEIGVVSRSANQFGSWTGSAGLNAALTRNLALGVNYTFYHYSFEQDAALVTGLLPRTNRHSVNVLLNAWAPVFQHGKRRNASR